MATLTLANITTRLNHAFKDRLQNSALYQLLYTYIYTDIVAVETAATALAARVTVIEPAVVNCTAADLTVTPALHANKLITLNRATGVAVTLPAATGTGNKYRIFIGTTMSGGNTVITATGAHLFGNAYVASDNATNVCLAFEAAGSTTMTLDGSTKGGVKGDIIELEDVAASVMLIRATFRETGSEATPFA